MENVRGEDMKDEEFKETVELMKACGFSSEFITVIKAIRLLIKSGKLHEDIKLLTEEGEEA